MRDIPTPLTVEIPDRSEGEDGSERVVLCDCSCPEWGKLGQGVCRCQCDCGRLINLCVACLIAGRRTECERCSRVRR